MWFLYLLIGVVSQVWFFFSPAHCRIKSWTLDIPIYSLSLLTRSGRNYIKKENSSEIKNTESILKKQTKEAPQLHTKKGPFLSKSLHLKNNLQAHWSLTNCKNCRNICWIRARYMGRHNDTGYWFSNWNPRGVCGSWNHGKWFPGGSCNLLITENCSVLWALWAAVDRIQEVDEYEFWD